MTRWELLRLKMERLRDDCSDRTRSTWNMDSSIAACIYRECLLLMREAEDDEMCDSLKAAGY